MLEREFKWTEECSAKVKEYRLSDHSARKTLNVTDFVNLLDTFTARQSTN